jgi:3-hydroxymyristoyl/3-hydroxydecanoyl-(acyl carrier protein) dehydratase
MSVVDPEIVRESIAPARAEFEITVPEDLFYLEGHFPQQPILPGVVQVHWAVKLAAARLGIDPSFKGIEALKFHRVIKPLTPLKLTLEQDEKTGKLHFSYQSDLGVHSQGRIVFE